MAFLFFPPSPDLSVCVCAWGEVVTVGSFLPASLPASLLLLSEEHNVLIKNKINKYLIYSFLPSLPFKSTVTILCGYGSYLLADLAEASDVLSMVAAGLYLSFHRLMSHISPTPSPSSPSNPQ